MYPSIFLHCPMFGTVFLHLSFFFSFLCFPANNFRNVHLHFLIILPFPASFIELYCYTFLMHPFLSNVTIFFHFTLLWYPFITQSPNLIELYSHIFYPLPFWKCTLPFSYTGPFLELYSYIFHSFLIFNVFPPIILGMYTYTFQLFYPFLPVS
jgi:hypothetical protein